MCVRVSNVHVYLFNLYLESDINIKIKITYHKTTATTTTAQAATTARAITTTTTEQLCFFGYVKR